MHYRLFLVVGLANLPLVSTAQTAPAALTHFYVGLGASALSSAPASSYNSFRHIGPSLSAGVQFTPRWALQVGAALSWRKEADSRSYVPSPGQLPTVVEYDSRITTLTVPILARYTLTLPAERFHGDVVGGVTLLHTVSQFNSSSTAAGQAPYLADEHFSVNRASIALGLAARYSLLPQLELTADGLANVNVTNSFYSFSDRFFLNLLVGVRYHFGQH
jgi:hypothetical protein